MSLVGVMGGAGRSSDFDPGNTKLGDPPNPSTDQPPHSSAAPGQITAHP